MITICLRGGDDHDPSKTAVKASSAAILARLLVMNTNFLAQLTSEQSTFLLLQKAGIPIKDNILLCLVDVWLDKVSTACVSIMRILLVIVEVSVRYLGCIAICILSLDRFMTSFPNFSSFGKEENFLQHLLRFHFFSCSVNLDLAG